MTIFSIRGEGPWPKKVTGAPDGCVTPLFMGHSCICFHLLRFKRYCRYRSGGFGIWESCQSVRGRQSSNGVKNTGDRARQIQQKLYTSATRPNPLNQPPWIHQRKLHNHTHTHTHARTHARTHTHTHTHTSIVSLLRYDRPICLLGPFSVIHRLI